jgi:hypothetical protein
MRFSSDVLQRVFDIGVEWQRHPEAGIHSFGKELVIRLRQGTSFLPQICHCNGKSQRDGLVGFKESLFFLANHFVLWRSRRFQARGSFTLVSC